MSAGVGGSQPLDLAVVARYSIPTHVALPWVLWGLAAASQGAHVWVFLGIHALFPVVLVVSYRYWKGQGIELAFLIVLNHVATAVSGGLAAWVASGV